MITAELSPNTFVPVDLVQWTPAGRVQVRRCRVIDDFRIFAVYMPITVMKLIHSDGRKALAAELARLPHPRDPAGSISVERP